MCGKGGGQRDWLRGPRFVAGFLSLAAIAGCDDDRGREARNAAVATEIAPAEAPKPNAAGQTEQVVHHIVPIRPVSSVADSNAAASNGVALSEQKEAANAATAAPASAPSTGLSRPVEGITSKHLEAELNRLEAELGN